MDLGDGRVITNFIRQIKHGEPITIYGDGSQTRSFCYVDDTVRGLVAFMAAASSDILNVGPVNIGNPGCEFTMNELVDVFRKALRRPGEGGESGGSGGSGGGAFAVKYLPRTQDDPMCRRPVITKAEELFGFRCNVGLEEGIQRVWDYFL
jgi:nucleoside-diphosphate-sugar epimerase